MNWTNILGPLAGLIKESNLYDSVAKILTVSAGIIAGLDADHEGADDLIAGVMIAAADAVSAYGRQDNNEHGNVVDALIAGITRYRAEMVTLGKIVQVDR